MTGQGTIDRDDGDDGDIILDDDDFGPDDGGGDRAEDVDDRCECPFISLRSPFGLRAISPFGLCLLLYGEGGFIIIFFSFINTRDW